MKRLVVFGGCLALILATVFIGCRAGQNGFDQFRNYGRNNGAYPAAQPTLSNPVQYPSNYNQAPYNQAPYNQAPYNQAPAVQVPPQTNFGSGTTNNFGGNGTTYGGSGTR